MIRLATYNDLNEILNIYSYARAFMSEKGNPTQWAEDYPPLSLLKKDIEQSQLFVIEENNAICCVFAFIIGVDSTYLNIKNGGWLSDKEYGTIHRIASNGKVKGCFNQVVGFCEDKIHHLRIDTHKDNKIMQHLILKNNFKKCGIIYVHNGSERIAYEKI